jgi:RimJ/RimL family protein N-acetyltransferase
MSITLRPLEVTTDLPALLDLLNPYYLEPVTPEQWLKNQGEELAQGSTLRQIVAEHANGALLGYSLVKREYGTWDPGRLHLWLIVSPPARNRGIGTRLYEDGLRFVSEHNAYRLDTAVRDDDSASLAYAQRRGFAIDRHMFGSRLDVQAFDETPFADAIEAAQATGIRFFSMSDLGNTPEAQRKLYELNKYVDGEIPGERVFPSFEEFSEMVYGSEWYVPDGQIIAADGDRWVGMSAVGYFPQTESMRVMITGVESAYRGRKIGMALKLLTHRCARQRGVKHLYTGNDSHNAPMLAVNEKLGYTKLRGTYYLTKLLA